MRSAAHIRSHPIHPFLVTFPVAFFTGAAVTDVIAFAGGWHSLHAVAYYMCWAGVAGGVLAAVPGVIDYIKTVPPQSSAARRGAKHAIANTVVLLLFVSVIILRKTGFEWYILIPELVATATMYYSAWMGATLVSRNQIGIDHRYAEAGKWKELRVKDPVFPLLVAEKDELVVNQMKLLVLGRRRLVLARTENRYVVFDDRCTHRGGSLAGGVMMRCVVHCPWHGSQYDVNSGECVAGPAEVGIQVYHVTEQHGRVFLQQP